MDLALTDDQRALHDLARQILGDLATQDRLRQAEAGPERFDAVLWAELARAGLLGVAVPEAEGGLGGGLVETCLLLEEQGRTAAPVPLYATLILGGMPVAAFGSPAQRSRLLPGVVSGETVLTGALPADGGEPIVEAGPSGGGWALEGVVDAVPAAGRAAAMVVPARTAGGDGGFLVDPRGPGVRLERQDATTREPRARVSLEGAPGEALGEDAAPGLARWLLERATVGLCALQVGGCERALRMTAEYVTNREQFERPLGSFQAVQQRLADAFIDVEAMRWTMWQAAWRLDEGLPSADEVAIAKFWAAEGGQRVSAAAQHLHGGIGVDVEYPLHRFTLMAKDLELALGSATRQLVHLGDAIAEGREA